MSTIDILLGLIIILVLLIPTAAIISYRFGYQDGFYDAAELEKDYNLDIIPKVVAKIIGKRMS